MSGRLLLYWKRLRYIDPYKMSKGLLLPEQLGYSLVVQTWILSRRDLVDELQDLPSWRLLPNQWHVNFHFV